jgi:hypothetical protein
MAGTVVVYVTRSGHAKALADDIGKRLGTEALEIGDLVNRRGLLGFIKSGAQASMGAATPIREPKADLSSASAVVLVQPVWASSVCPPLRSWLKAHKEELTGKSIGLLSTNRGSDGGPLQAKFEKEFGPLAAFAVIAEKTDGATRIGILDGFQASLQG